MLREHRLHWRHPKAQAAVRVARSAAEAEAAGASRPRPPPPASVPGGFSLALDRVSQLHGFLCLRSIPSLLVQSNYSRHELFATFLRFKSLCCLSPVSGPQGIDAGTFQRGVVRLSVEDDRFVQRVFALVDTDNSNSIEWDEFLVSCAALEKGSAEIKARFACQVYDLDGDGFIGRQDLTTMFQASSMLKAARVGEDGDDEEEDGLSDAVIAMFVQKVFDTFGCAESGLISFECVLRHIKAHASTSDVWDLFGRSMLKESAQSGSGNKRDPRGRTIQSASAREIEDELSVTRAVI